MKPMLTKSMLALFAFAVVAAVVATAQQSRNVLGKIDFQVLLEAAPGVPATPAEAGKRAYGPDITAQGQPVALDPFYAPFYNRVAAARDVIKDAVANRAQNQEVLLQRSRAQANADPIVSRMGGVDKISEMSEDEAKQAAAQAVGSYQQSLSGGPGNSRGMQAIMERMMNDPAYQARFEKMTKKEQEAEIRKYMGNAGAPPPPVGETAAERRAKQDTNETTAVMASHNDLAALFERLRGIDAEFSKRDQAILATPGGHDQIAKDVGARIARVPLITGGEATFPDPVKLQVLQREQVTRDRARSTWELQQRTALYAQRKAQYKEVATAYGAWLKQNLGGVNNQTAKLLDDANAELAVRCEEELISSAEKLAQYTAEATGHAAQFEWSYQKRMSEPAAHGAPK